MTADVELPPLPPLHIAPSVEPVDYPDVAQALMDYARACVAHATAAKDAEIEALRAENARLRVAKDADRIRNRAAEGTIEALRVELREMRRTMAGEFKRAELLAEALRELVALGHPRDPAIIAAKNALRDHDQEEGSGAFWGSSPKSGGPDWTGFDG